MNKILDLQSLLVQRDDWKARGARVVFTNGCFDLVHGGHIHLFRLAKEMGEILVVAVNDDASVKRIKGPTRPIFPLQERLEVLEAVASIDALVPFSGPTPRDIIAKVLPDILVKGGDWALDEVVGRDEVVRAGGKTVVIPYLPFHSSSQIIEKIRGLCSGERIPE